MDKKLKKLLETSEKIELGGGRERIERHHKSGKLTARERVKLLQPLPSRTYLTSTIRSLV